MILKVIRIGKIALFAGSLAGCVPGTGVPYETAVEKTRERLEAGKPTELFALQEREGRGRTDFRFIAGNARDKRAHAFPDRVRATVISKSRSSDSLLTVEARCDGFLVHPEKRSLAWEWRKTLLEAIQTNRSEP